jgi:hypothetical protein
MSTSSVQTAQIIQFPAFGRKPPADIRKQAAPAAELKVQAVAVGEAWYHAAAIQDAKRPGDR